MTYKSIAISSGHSTKCQGAVGPSPWGLNEVAEATRVVDRVATELRNRGVKVESFHDTVSTTQDQNLSKIVNWHNGRSREIDISCHFNASKVTPNPVGTEVWYVSQQKLAAELSAAMAESGLKNRGAKYSSSLYFLAHTNKPAVLLEVAFVDSQADVKIYQENFDQICASIATVLGGKDQGAVPPDQPDEPAVMTGTCSWFGGPEDTGVSPSEGLAFIYSITEDNQFLFLPMQPAGTTGLARRLNTAVHYAAMRFDYSINPKETLLSKKILVRNPKTGFALTCTPADWGPHEEKTGRLIDLSPSMMMDLDLETDDVVEVIFPYQGEGSV